MEAIGLKFLRHRLGRQIGDMTNHAGNRQPDARPVWFVIVLAAVIMWVAQDGVASNDVERQRLVGQPR